ncbi:hypothetical protein PPERSA_01164 [Pseudocohnilembus persalinus]|uniref:Transmembrane protein n=1 Tax=Pseudocohnilembus persalinus TaxID=266149 RepID=A0A0V0R1Q2_PSEPJ|nr:hypothetical protein PPERSA_01164 [Pseudocohnilembus persalinus]|eukprot:KRX08234.1 hypothetical protein PPERSA_01164 [Pseudocohnilembus persalinus]
MEEIKHNKSVLTYLSAELSIEMTEMIEYVLPIYSISCLIFSALLQDGFKSVSVYIYIGIGVGIIHAYLPMQKWNEYLFKVDEAPPNKQLYQEVSDKFTSNYPMENPATGKHAKKEFCFKKLLSQFNIHIDKHQNIDEVKNNNSSIQNLSEGSQISHNYQTGQKNYTSSNQLLNINIQKPKKTWHDIVINNRINKKQDLQQQYNLELQQQQKVFSKQNPQNIFSGTHIQIQEDLNSLKNKNYYENNSESPQVINDYCSNYSQSALISPVQKYNDNIKLFKNNKNNDYDTNKQLYIQDQKNGENKSLLSPETNFNIKEQYINISQKTTQDFNQEKKTIADKFNNNSQIIQQHDNQIQDNVCNQNYENQKPKFQFQNNSKAQNTDKTIFYNQSIQQQKKEKITKQIIENIVGDNNSSICSVKSKDNQ